MPFSLPAMGSSTAGVSNLRRSRRAIRIPTSCFGREMVEAGLLMSYGPDTLDSWRQTGVYTGRILKGAKLAELPVVRSTKFEFVINLQTARALGIEVPNSIQLLGGRGDRVM